MFLFFLRTNLSEFLFKKVIYHLASEFPNPETDNDINAYRDMGASTSSSTVKARYPDINGLDTVDAPLLHQRHPATPPVSVLPDPSDMTKMPV